jgi:hypothetical protein
MTVPSGRAAAQPQHSSLHLAISHEITESTSLGDLLRIELTITSDRQPVGVLRPAPPAISIITTTVEEDEHVAAHGTAK